MIEEYHLTEVSEVLIVQNLGAENSSSSQTDNVKKKSLVLVLGIGSTFGIHSTHYATEKKLQ